MAMKQFNADKQREQAIIGSRRRGRFHEFVNSLADQLPVDWKAENAFHIFLSNLDSAERYATVKECDVQLFQLQDKVRQTGRPRD